MKPARSRRLETLSRIFEPFYTTKEIGKGTGLGLSTVYGIVREMSGYIDVQSEPGSNTVFNVYFPVVEAAIETPAAIETARATAVRSLRGWETILLVEDEEAVRTLIRMSLEYSGYKVMDAGNAEAAIEICEGHPGPIHLAITDVVMPDVSGPKLADILVSLRKELKILNMSEHIENSGVRRNLGSGVPFLQKPFDPAQLCGKVREVLGQHC
ncbi:MAG TPA: response regulator [Blastocatellia bacterium]